MFILEIDALWSISNANLLLSDMSMVHKEKKKRKRETTLSHIRIVIFHGKQILLYPTYFTFKFVCIK